MFNPLNLLSKIIKSGNQKELDRIGKIVNRINSLEKKFEKYIQLFQKNTALFRDRHLCQHQVLQ